MLSGFVLARASEGPADRAIRRVVGIRTWFGRPLVHRGERRVVALQCPRRPHGRRRHDHDHDILTASVPGSRTIPDDGPELTAGTLATRSALAGLPPLESARRPGFAWRLGGTCGSCASRRT